MNEREKGQVSKFARKMADEAIESLNVKKFAGEWVRVEAVRKLLYNTFKQLEPIHNKEEEE
tara:strand:+ start:352 stop:534 length:183 start_codon:yes stop_codon:yes gene_type:complete